MKGTRVQSVVQELKGEKIDIIPWHSDPAKFVCNALSPAEISRVVVDETSRSMEVIVPDEYLSVAIGKRGQNVRLACKLTGWSIDVTSESQYSHAMRAGYESLLDLPDIGASTADALYEHGFYSVEELANAVVAELTQLKGIGETKAQALVEAARQAVEEMERAKRVEEDEAVSHVSGEQDAPEGVSGEAETSDQPTVPPEDL
jgi:N utilization substance protein A